jgi:hypothetical protein
MRDANLTPTKDRTTMRDPQGAELTLTQLTPPEG